MELERFKTLMMPLREKLQICARSILSNDVDAEDAVQETYLRLWNVRSQLDSHPNPHGFAMQTVKNICIDKTRSNKPKISLENANVVEGSIDPYTYTEQCDNMQIIRNIIDTLSELQRKIMLMRDIEGYELNEIADIIGSEAAAVRVNLSRARKKVRDTYIGISQIKQRI